MDMTLLGETIVAAAAGQKNYGFWMPAGGNTGVAGCEVFWNNAAVAFTLHLETKSSDQDDSAAVSIGSVSIATASATGATPVQYRFDTANAKDLVRYRLDSAKAGFVHLQTQDLRRDLARAGCSSLGGWIPL
jgi:hypothetical protein